MWGKTGIDIFILISGYFMCKSNMTIRRYCKVFFEIYFYQFVIYIIMLALGYETFGKMRIYHLLFDVFQFANASGYFECSFLIFYLFVPFMNKFINAVNRQEYRRFVLLLLFVFTGMSTFFRNVVIFGEVFWFMAVYFIGGYLRIYPPEWSKNLKQSVKLLIFSILFSCGFALLVIYKLSEYKFNNIQYAFFVSDANKLGAVLVSVFLFTTFKNLKIGYSRFINYIASTTFGVLLIHANSNAQRQFMWKDMLHVDTNYCLPMYVLIPKTIIIVVGVFVCCSLVDMIRIQLIEKPVFNHFESIEYGIRTLWQFIKMSIKKVYGCILVIFR